VEWCEFFVIDFQLLFCLGDNLLGFFVEALLALSYLSIDGEMSICQLLLVMIVTEDVFNRVFPDLLE
jgi:hypothetical protein